MFSNFLQPRVVYPTRIIDNAQPSLTDNIFSSCIDSDIISGNIIDKISDHMPNFLILQEFKKSELRVKYKKRDYSKFNEFAFNSDLNNENIAQAIINSNNVNGKYDIFQKHLERTMEKHAPLKNLSKKETELKLNPWLTKGILKSIRVKTKYYK